MKTLVVFCFLMAFVMASQAQGHDKEATEMDENELAMAAKIMDFEAEKQAKDTPNLVNADSGKSFHNLRRFNCMVHVILTFQVGSRNVIVPVKFCHSVA